MPNEIEAISKIEGIGKKAAAGEIRKIVPQDLEPGRSANKDSFEALMATERNKESLQVQRLEDTKKPTLIDEVRELNNRVDGWRISLHPEDLVAQARDAVTKIDEIKEKLATPGLEIKGPVQNLLKRKLGHIDENLKIALDRAGIEYEKVKTIEPVGNSPIERFLGMLSEGQNKLQNLTNDVSGIGVGQISPGDMLALQVKVNFVSQELEFFTNLLNKSLESTKTLMNVQI